MKRSVGRAQREYEKLLQHTRTEATLRSLKLCVILVLVVLTMAILQL